MKMAKEKKKTSSAKFIIQYWSKIAEAHKDTWSTAKEQGDKLKNSH